MTKRLFSLFAAAAILLTSASALTVEQAGQILTHYYVDTVPEQVLNQPSVEAMLQELGDPYTAHYSAEEYAKFIASIEDTEFVGIGTTSHYLPEGVVIVSVAPSSPAAEAGLLPGDCIISVDGHDTRGAAEADIDSWIFGDENTQVALTVVRGDLTFERTLTRRVVVFPSTRLDSIKDGVALITCSSFGSSTFTQFYDIISAYDNEVNIWIVDLRGNTGGDVFSAVYSAGCFAGVGQGILLRDSQGIYTSYLLDPPRISEFGYSEKPVSGFDSSNFLTMDPVFVLTDRRTASAAELFCAMIRDSGAGLIIGERTFGKGVAQTIFSDNLPETYFTLGDPAEFFTDGDVLKLTTDRAFSKQGVTYDLVGVIPHLYVPSSMAEPVAFLLAAPVQSGEKTLFLSGLNPRSSLANSFVIPLELLVDPANTPAVSALLSALPQTSSCAIPRGGVTESVSPAQAAEFLGAPYFSRSFSDIDTSAYRTEIDILAAYGLLSGPDNTVFLPDAPLDRASLCALLAKTLRPSLARSQEIFSDVPADAWYSSAVNALYEHGIVTGCSDGLFHPDDPVTREQFLVIMSRAARWMNMYFYEYFDPDGVFGRIRPTQELLDETFAPYSSWARPDIWLTQMFSPDEWQADPVPAAEVSREQAAATLYRLLLAAGILTAGA